MTMIRTETAKTITDTWYVHKITHNKYHPQFFTTTVIHLQSYFYYIHTINIPLSGEIISNESLTRNINNNQQLFLNNSYHFKSSVIIIQYSYQKENCSVIDIDYQDYLQFNLIL